MFTFQVQAETQRWLRAPQMVETLLSEAGNGLDRAVHDVVFDLLEAAVDRSPFWTGTLAAAHTGEMTSFAEGHVFIRPGLVHPILGGDPHDYSLEVHQRKPWFDWVVTQDAPGILDQHLNNLAHQIEVAWSGGFV